MRLEKTELTHKEFIFYVTQGSGIKFSTEQKDEKHKVTVVENDVETYFTFMEKRQLKKLYDFLNVQIFTPLNELSKEEHEKTTKALEAEIEQEVLGRSLQ